MIRFPSLGHTGKEQIEMADILIMNKIDLINEKEAEKVRKRLVSLNERSIIAKALNAKVPPEFIFGINRGQKAEKHKTHKIESEVFVFESEAIFDKEKFLAFAAAMPREIYRSKGFVKCKGHESYVFNFVAGRFDLEPLQLDAEKTELVFIGKDVLRLEKKVKEELEKISKG
jgi:G3E family GTPase